MTVDQLGGLWSAILDRDTAPELDVSGVVAGVDLQPDDVLPAATAAWWHASHLNRPIGRADLLYGVRSRNASSLERLARRIEPSVGWADLVLPPRPLQLLRELDGTRPQPRRPCSTTGACGGGGRGAGIAALFAGPPGTGKTLAAEVIAGELRLRPLHASTSPRSSTSTSARPRRTSSGCSTEAERVNGVLFFDEADALFGKRSEVKDAHDRYANVEIAYLLQRMEAFDGVAILATNLSANLDEAFARRLDAMVDFPLPGRARPPRRSGSGRCGRASRARTTSNWTCWRAAFELSGGNIRNIALAAAYFAVRGRAAGGDARSHARRRSGVPQARPVGATRPTSPRTRRCCCDRPPSGCGARIAVRRGTGRPGAGERPGVPRRRRPRRRRELVG